MPKQPPRRDLWIELDLPQAISGGARHLAESAGWQMEPAGATWRACTRENYLKQRPGLLTIRPVDAPGLRPGTGYEILGALMDQEHLSNPAMRVLIARELARLEGLGDSDIPALLARFQMLFTNTPTSALPAVMSSFFMDAAQKQLPGSTLFLVDLAPELSARYTLVRALLTSYVWPSIGELPAGRATATSGVFGAQPLVYPALLALAPYLCGILAPRARATGVWLFGSPIAGAAWPSNQLIDAAKPLDERFTGKRQRSAGIPPAITTSQITIFLRWWVEQVNRVLGIATDPSLFKDKAGRYDPRRHMAYLASIERVFQGVHEVLVFAERSEGARLRAAYDTLDCLDGMRLGSFADFTTPSKVEKSLDRLKTILPPDVAAVALPACQDAADALNQVRDQFYPGPHRTASGLIGLAGRAQSVSWDRVIPDYLRIDRNSAHSFLREVDPDQEPDKLMIFLSHSGEMPIKLASLAFFWLLVHAAEPALLEQRLTRR
jgi:hypothetical protein